MMLQLIILLLLGGLLAWQAQRFGDHLPRWVALVTVALGLVLLLTGVAGRPARPESQSTTASANRTPG